jgi:hypothetical protein
MDSAVVAETLEAIGASALSLAAGLERAAGLDRAAGPGPLPGGADPLGDLADACLEGLAGVAAIEARLAAVRVHLAAGFAAAEEAMTPPGASGQDRTVRQICQQILGPTGHHPQPPRRPPASKAWRPSGMPRLELSPVGTPSPLTSLSLIRAARPPPSGTVPINDPPTRCLTDSGNRSGRGLAGRPRRLQPILLTSNVGFTGARPCWFCRPAMPSHLPHASLNEEPHNERRRIPQACRSLP